MIPIHTCPSDKQIYYYTTRGRKILRYFSVNIFHVFFIG